ncbi:hypothetical protein BO70DRAFT_386928 [Aspergillus heteromorphus CBS 117.55]|uniref:CREG-like beta-barrel domain-containing protein n=1 Tax=Aspergillus heteromorphus CBS 117.55 TaxID=1448321 RepID=A0A317WAJ8_9EURO|nr:uncharacterized protein BO70DRAFT_386928 [Aspergillus heteromorphus CBS 117.55]PWY83534.1 hypothetical protein BO70DRAFT_386928 [Aspergillus heteromorphus CBS 117.55]
MARPFVALLSALAVLGPLLPVGATPIADAQALLTDPIPHPNHDPHPDTLYTHNSPSDLNQEEEHDLAAPSWFTSALLARRLLALSPTGIASTIFPSPLPPNSHTPASLAGHSISLTEYLADCDPSLPTSSKEEDEEGNPTFLALRVATTFRNTASGSNISLSLDWWSHINDTAPVFPGFPLSPRPFETPLPAATEAALSQCYLEKHPDAKVWLPGREGSPHASFWARMVVTEVYWIGGFGGLNRIGWLNVTEWKGIREDGSGEGLGDGSGRGWGDVRLPGEGW